MTINLAELVSPAELAEALDAGYVRQQQHPELPLTILNYTQRAQFENIWTPATRVCRGVIHDADSQVIARPFQKFFNHGQQGAASIDLGASVHVTDKADGSLGILYPTPDGYAVATRGSFTSDQATHATELYRREYAARFTPDPSLTVLVEIVYPANRIVLNYGGMDDLILLGAIETRTGRVIEPEAIDWPGPRAATFSAPTFADALALPPRSNAEGIVVRCLTTGGMLKIKQEDYLALHRIVTGLTARTVWEHLVAGKPLEELIAPLPDEFHSWVRQVANGITTSVDQRSAEIDRAYNSLLAALPKDWTRRDFAALASALPDSWAIFSRLDGRDPRPKLLKQAKPEPYLTPTGVSHNEDNA